MCSNCGDKLESENDLCAQCKEMSVPEDSNKEDRMKKKNTSRDSEDEYEQLLIVATGNKYSFYKESWSKISNSNILSWNWAPFLFSIFWLGYRKMYMNVILLCAIFLFADFLQYIIYYNFDGVKVDAITFFLNLATILSLGILGNWIYKLHIEKFIKTSNLEGVDKNHRLRLLQVNGGASWVGILTALGIFVIYAILSLYLFPIPM